MESREVDGVDGVRLEREVGWIDAATRRCINRLDPLIGGGRWTVRGGRPSHARRVRGELRSLIRRGQVTARSAAGSIGGGLGGMGLDQVSIRLASG